jgi:cysteinyl-tRNA synthetase
MEDDLSTPRALAELWGLLRDPGADPREALSAVLDMDGVLGLSLDKAVRGSGEDAETVKEIEGLIAARSAAKKAKDFAGADHIRDGLKKRGIILEDGPSGTLWRRA